MKHFIHKLILWMVFSILFFAAKAQHHACGTEVLDQMKWSGRADSILHRAATIERIKTWREQNPGLHSLPSAPNMSSFLQGGAQCTPVNYVIPVVVHIVHRNGISIDSGHNIADAQVGNQISALNDAFANAHGKSINTGIQFALAKHDPLGNVTSGILRHEDDSLSSIVFASTQQHLDLFNQYSWNPREYLNIYVVEEIIGSIGSSFIGGFAYMPTVGMGILDGIVMRFDVFGHHSYGSPIINISDGEALVHEVGHYLGLFHPWHGGCTSGNTSIDCSTQGDLCCDVPQSNGPVSICDTTSTSCPNGGNDAVRNYMSYAGGACSEEFTEDQLSIMLTTLEVLRRPMWQPIHVNKTLKNSSLCVWTARFTGPALGCINDTFTYTAYQLDSNLTYLWTWTNAQGVTFSQSGQGVMSLSNLAADVYEVVLKVIDGGDTVQFQSPFPLRVTNCQPIADRRSHWIFGDHAGIIFLDNGEVIPDAEVVDRRPKNMNSSEATTIISNDRGELLFYVGYNDSIVYYLNDTCMVVFGKNYEQVTKSLILGAPSSAQGVLAIPFQNDTNSYHILTVSASESGKDYFTRNVIDLSKIDTISDDKSYGEITHRFEQITDSNGITPRNTEMLTAIKRCDDSTYWVITTDAVDTTMEVYILSDTGIVFSHRNKLQNIGIGNFGYTRARIRISPDGNWLLVSNQLYRFCRQDASVEFVWTDTSFLNDIKDGCFSPNSGYLYFITNHFNSSSNNYFDLIHQFDINTHDISGSAALIDSTIAVQQVMQLGPDNRIYLSRFGQPNLSVINHPNQKERGGNEVGYQRAGISLSVGVESGFGMLGFPNYIEADDPLTGAQDFTVKNNACLDVTFISTSCCADSYLWYFGDGDSSLETQPRHLYQEAGLYFVQLIISADTISKWVQVGLTDAMSSISGSDLICPNFPVHEYTVATNADYEYTWSIVGGSGTGNRSSFNVIWGAAGGAVSIIIFDQQSGCIDTNSLTVLPYTDSTLVITYNLQNCNTIVITSPPFCGFSRKWDFGDGDTSNLMYPIHTYQDTGTFVITMVTGGDTIVQEVYIGIINDYKNIEGDTTFCELNQIHFYSAPFAPNLSYQWTTNAGTIMLDSLNTANIELNQTGFIHLIITANEGCADTVSLEVKRKLDQEIDFNYTVTNCLNVKFETDEYCGLDKNWIFGDGQSSIGDTVYHTFAQRGMYHVSLIIDGDTITKTLNLDLAYSPEIIGETNICDTTDYFSYKIIPYNSTFNYSFGGLNFSDQNPQSDSSFLVKFGTVNAIIQIAVSNDIQCSTQYSLPILVNDPIGNFIMGNDPYCTPDSLSFISGSNPTGGLGVYDIQWWKSSDGDQYESINNSNGFNHYLDSAFKYDGTNFFRYKRVIESGDCISESNIVNVYKVLPHNEIFLVDTPCLPGLGFEIEGNDLPRLVENNVFQTFKYCWQTSEDGENWTDCNLQTTYGASDGYKKFVDNLSASQIFVRRRMYIPDSYGVPLYCESYSNIIPIVSKFYISKQPVDFEICHVDSQSFSFHMEFDVDTTIDYQIFAEYKNSGETSFNTLDTVFSLPYTTKVSKNSNYHLNDTFRFRIETNCGIKYSEKVLVKYITTSPGDIWMRDSWKDVGLEPNPDSAHYDIVLSPDIWNRQQNDSIFEHENPEHSIYDPNFLYVKVRNRGNENTIPTPLYLYWTFASINGEAWDLAWLDIPENQFQHYYSNGNPIPNWTFPLGSRINDTPIMVPSIAPGDSMIIAHPWFPPSPDWYYKRGSNKEKVGSYGDKINVCVLARLEECEVYPHRMAFDEIFDDHVKYNAINNNNIITRNLWVEDQLGDPVLIPKGSGEYAIGFKLPPISCGGLIPDTETPPNEIPDSPVTFRPCLEGVTSGFFDMWEVYFEPDEILKNAILSANPPISEVIYIGDNIFKFTDSNLCIPNIVIEDNQTVFMELIYAPRNGWGNILTQKYTFGIAQYLGESENSVGACYFTIDNTANMFHSMHEYDEYEPPSEYNSQSMTVSPNPTTGVFDMYLDEETKQQFSGQMGTVVVADGYGIPMITLENIPAEATTSISLFGYRAGVFNVKYIINNTVFYKYVIKTDQ